MPEVIEKPINIPVTYPEQDDGLEPGKRLSDLLDDAPPVFGRCPVCQKPLRPRCKVTGEPKAPPVGTGYESRAKCTGCGTIICYVGNGEWRVLLDSDLTEEDHFANKMGF